MVMEQKPKSSLSALLAGYAIYSVCVILGGAGSFFMMFHVAGGQNASLETGIPLILIGTPAGFVGGAAVGAFLAGQFAWHSNNGDARIARAINRRADAEDLN